MKKSLLFLILFLVFMESAVRLSGITDYPLYDADSQIGYIPKASQSGSFLNTHDWAFNALHMGVSEEFKPTDVLDTLLISDSIVYGGNHLTQQEKLGSQLQKVIGGKVWPISAQSWGLRNELIYLKQHPEVVKQVDQIIFILNGGDFDIASSWVCEMTHPRSYPLLRTTFLLRKYVHDWDPCGSLLPEYKVPDGDWHAELLSFIQSKEMQGKKITFFMYVGKAEVVDKAMQSGSNGIERFGNALKEMTHQPVYSIARDSRWSASMYRDPMHPTAEGNHVLANIINKPEGNDLL